MKKRASTGNHMLKRSYLRHLVPVTVWLLAVAGVVWLFHQQSQRFEVLGIVQGEMREVATNCPGRLTSVSVELYDHVTEGQVVAVVDTVLDNEYSDQELRAQLSTTTARIEHLMAQMIPTQEDAVLNRTDRETDRIADLRQFAGDVDSARLRVLELKAQIATDRMALNELAGQIRMTQGLVEKEAVAPIQLENLKSQHEALAATLAENEDLLNQAEVNLDKAQQRLEEFASQQPLHPDEDSRLEVIRKAIKVEERQMEEVSAQLAALAQRRSIELTSPFDGVVSQILKREGETVTAGDPIMMIVRGLPSVVIGYARQDQIGLLREDMVVDIIKTRDPAQIASTRVIFVGPTVEQQPALLWSNPNFPQWGLPFKVEIPQGFTVVPGEVVGIRGL